MNMAILTAAKLLLLVSLGCMIHVQAVVGKKDWNKVDWSKAEKDLEEGDDAELLKTEDSIAIAEMEKRKQQPLSAPEGVGLKDPAEWVKHQQAMTGPAMLFCSLKRVNPRDNKQWGNESLKQVAYEWRELLKTAGLEAQVYDISEHAKDKTTNVPTGHVEPKLLVTLQTGWRGYELRDFLLEREELEELEWDQVKYSPSDLEAIRANRGAGNAFASKDPMAAIKRQLAADGIEATGGPAAHVGAEPAAAQRSKAGKKSKGGKKNEKKQKKAKVVKGKSKKASDDAAAEL